jgi:hypothetical protein
VAALSNSGNSGNLGNVSDPVYAVAEPTARFALQVRNLALSIKPSGGSLQLGLVAGSDTAGQWQADLAYAPQTAVFDVERVSTRFPHANKLAGLARIVADGPPWAILSDCDIVFDGAPRATPETGTSAVLRADPANRNRVPLPVWRGLGEQLHEPDIARLADAGTLPYVNSGLLHVSAAVQTDLCREWQRAVDELSAALTGRPPAPWQFYLDQIALTVAILRLRVDVAPLPAGENIPTHVRTAKVGTGLARSLHYHDAHTCDGFLLPPYSDWLDEPVTRVNNRLAEHLGRPVPSLAVASLRYHARRRGRDVKHALQRQ